MTKAALTANSAAEISALASIELIRSEDFDPGDEEIAQLVENHGAMRALSILQLVAEIYKTLKTKN